MSVDPREQLERLGAQPAPSPDPVFVDRTEDRLRAVAAAGGAGEPGRAPGVGGWRRRTPVAALAAVLLVIVAVIIGTAPDHTELRLLAAADAVVVHPGGAVERAVSGLELGEGDLVRTGPRGSAEAGGLVLGPNMAARVVDGRLRVAPDLSVPPVSTVPTTSVPLPDVAGSPPPGDPSPSTEPPPARETSATPGAEQPPEALVLRARWQKGVVTAAWSRYEGERFAAYLVLRAAAPDEPEYGRDGATTVVAVVRDRDQTGAFDREPPADPLYRVVAVDREGRELARSDAVTPSAPDDEQAPGAIEK